VSPQNDAARRWYTARRRELRELVWAWDPLGIMGVAEDEYDALIDTALSALADGGTDADLALALRSGLACMACDGYSGAAAERASADAALAPVVARVTRWWTECPSHP
jgi:hypothetical protein